MPVNSDFRDLFSALVDAEARFLVVGAYAVVHHTEPRYTRDLDLWTEPSVENAARCSTTPLKRPSLRASPPALIVGAAVDEGDSLAPRYPTADEQRLAPCLTGGIVRRPVLAEGGLQRLANDSALRLPPLAGRPFEAAILLGRHPQREHGGSF